VPVSSQWHYRALSSRQRQVCTILGRPPQAPVPACRAWTVSRLCDAVLALPKAVAPKRGLVQCSPDVANSPLHRKGCPALFGLNFKIPQPAYGRSREHTLKIIPGVRCTANMDHSHLPKHLSPELPAPYLLGIRSPAPLPTGW